MTKYGAIAQATIALSACLFTGLVQARGVSPYLPLNLSPEIESKVERVLILGDIPILRRPIAAATVLNALPRACQRDEVLCGEVRAYLDAYMQDAGLTHASMTLAGSHGAVVTLPNQHGERSDSNGSISAAAYLQAGDHLLLNIGGVANEEGAAPTGSLLSAGFSWAQLDIGYRGHWTSPFTDSAMLISTEAPTMPSLTLGSYESLTPLNIQYELSVSRASHSDRIETNSGYTQGNPRIANLFLGAAPFAGWTVGFNRLAQFGGGSRGGSDPADIFKAWVDPAGSDNRAAGEGADEEQGNQQASFVSNFVFPGNTPFSVYFEYAGEDTFRYSNLYLGNSSLAAGVHVPALFKRVNLVYEISEWQNSWWQHHIYLDGVTNKSHVLGHWGGDWRANGDAPGAQSQMLKLSFAMRGGNAGIRYRVIDNEKYSGTDYVRGHDLTLSYAWEGRQFVAGGELQLGRDVYDEHYQRLSGFVRFVPGIARMPELYSQAKDEPGADVFVDVGMSRVRRTYDPYDPGGMPRRYDASTAPHFGLGVRRRASERSDIGVRLELDRVGGMSLVALRALDYRYRTGKHLALNAFAGAVRYATPTPAFGWYFGAGLQWRDLLPRWDVAVDYRRPDGVQRDKLLANDYKGGSPDEFYDMEGIAAYVSYRF